MDPPSYDEARLHPPTLSVHAPAYPPPPSYDASLPSPPTPPPTYGEAVTVQPDPYPVLTTPTVTRSESPPPQTPGVTIHPITQIGVTPPPSTAHLRDAPGLVNCPHCHRSVTTTVTYVPGKSAWCMCLLLAVMGLVCGICLIPLVVHRLQDVHHSCPLCENQIHVYSR